MGLGIGIAELNYYMKNTRRTTLVPADYFWHSLYDALKANVNKTRFVGDLAEITMQTSHPFTYQGFDSTVQIPSPKGVGFIKQYIPLKRAIANAGITGDALRKASTSDSSFGSAVELALAEQKRDFLWGRELDMMGDGTGRLARVVSASAGSAAVTITCDNTYADFGVENVALIKVGQWVEIYNATGSQASDASAVTKWVVTAVSFGNRDNSTATTGTFTISCTAGQESTIAAFANNGAIVFRAGTMSLGLSDSAGAGSFSGAAASTAKCYEITNPLGSVDVGVSLPMGLLGLCQNATYSPYSDGSIDCTMDVFQGLARSSYATLNTPIYRLVSGSYIPTATYSQGGTPGDWSLSVVSDAMNEVDTTSGGFPDIGVMSSKMAMALTRKQKSEGGTVISVPTSEQLYWQKVTGGTYAKWFERPDGKWIPIQVSNTVPDNVQYWLRLEDIEWEKMPTASDEFDFLRLTGDIWSYMGDRYDAFEAPGGCYTNLGAVRCDRHVVIQDMRTDV
jgi:hypothetical protein